MKRTLLILLGLALLPSCRKEIPSDAGGARELSAVIAEQGTEASGQEEGKTAFSPVGEGYDIFWSEGDRISVGGHAYVLSSGAGTKNGRFSAVSSAATAPYKAICPASIRLSDTRISLPAVQNYVEGNIAGYPLYAESGTAELTFGSLCGVLRLKVSGTGLLQSLTLSADQPLSGPADLSVSPGERYPHATVSEGSGTLTVRFATPLSLASPQVILICLPVNEYSGFKLTFNNTKGYSTRRSLGKTLSIKRGKYSSITLTSLAFDRWNGHRFIDIGLDSHLRWAACNLGAEKPQDRGDYYAWAATSPHYATLSPLNWKSGKSAGYTLANAPYYNSGTYTTYTQAGTALDAADDAATASWGAPFRLPTESEWRELIDNCFWLRMDSYRNTGISGFAVFKAKGSADKGFRQWISGGSAPSGQSYDAGRDAHIFLPYAGYFEGTGLTETATGAYYYSASLSTADWAPSGVASDKACVLYFGYESGFEKGNYERYWGFSMRPVIEKSDDETK